MAPRKKATSKRASAASTPVPIELPTEQPPSSPLTSLNALGSLPTTSRIPSSLNNGSAAARRAPPSAFTDFRTALNKELATVTEKLRQRRAVGAQAGLEEQVAGELVEGVIDAVGRSAEGDEVQEYEKNVRRAAIERALEEMLFDVALYPVDESSANLESYGLLCDILDIILTFAEREYISDSIPLESIYNLIEVQTLAVCERIFSWIESRVERLTKGMQAMRGKGPVLLRISNELLRRLPRSKQEHVVFSGRILLFLSSVFPLGEKSGVNLRGNFNVGKMTSFEETPADESKEKMDVDEGKEKKDDTTELYTTFWSLQRTFTNPPALFSSSPASTSSTPAPATDSFAALHTALEKTLIVFSAATKKEKELGGASKNSASAGKQKAKLSSEEEDESLEHYFFPKFLTSKNLLELEIADPAFRRQILVQMLILYQYLLSFVPAEHERIAKRTTNTPALLNAVLTPENEKWIRKFKDKTLNEMDAMEGGRRFRQSIELILKREQNWIDWKLKSCIPFEKPPLANSQSEVARNKLKALGKKPKAYMYSMGNPNLSRTWQHNTTSLEGFVPSEDGSDDFDKIVRGYTMTSRMVKVKKGALAQAESSKASSKIAELNAELESLDVKLSALHWRAIRSARSSHLNLFADIKAGDLDLLLTRIDEERRKKEEAQEKAERAARGEKSEEPEHAEGAEVATVMEGVEAEEAEDAAKEKAEKEASEQPEEEVVAPVVEGASAEDKPAEPSKEEEPAAVEVDDSSKRQEQENEEAAAKAKLPEVPAEEKEQESRRATPQTPKRPREKEDEGDVEMAEGESPETKKRKMAVEAVPVEETPAE